MKKETLFPLLGIFILMSAFTWAHFNPSKSELRYKHFQATVALGDSAIMAEYLDGFGRLENKAVLAAKKSIESFFSCSKYECTPIPADLVTDFQVLQRSLGNVKTSEYFVQTTNLNIFRMEKGYQEQYPGMVREWKKYVIRMLNACPPTLQEEIENTARKQESGSIWLEYYDPASK
jgi:hypothetical protein